MNKDLLLERTVKIGGRILVLGAVALVQDIATTSIASGIAEKMDGGKFVTGMTNIKFDELIGFKKGGN